MTALEAETELEARREAFELIEGRFEGVHPDDHACAEKLIDTLRAELVRRREN